jgi:hypothetical protein
VGVVPKGARLFRAEAVGVALAGLDGVLGEAGNTVLGIGDIYAVPVDRNSRLDVFVDEDHLDQVALPSAQFWTGGFPVERPGLDGLAGAQLYPGLLCGEGEPAIRLSRILLPQIRHAHRLPAAVALPMLVRVGMSNPSASAVRVAGAVTRLGAAAVVDVLVRHHAELVRQHARLHRVREPGRDAHAQREHDGGRPHETHPEGTAHASVELDHRLAAAPLANPQCGCTGGEDPCEDEARAQHLRTRREERAVCAEGCAERR